MSQLIFNVAIAGYPGSGKNSIKDKMEATTVRRNENVFSFRGHIASQDGVVGHLKIDFAVALVDSSWNYEHFMRRPYIDQIRRLATAPRTCVVGTKRDMIPSDCSEEDLIARRHPVCAAYYHRSPYFSVNCRDGHGVDVLCEYIVDTLTDAPHRRKPRIGESLLFAFDQLIIRALDVVASLFSLPIPNNVNEDTADSEELDDEAVTELLQSSPMVQAWHASLKARSKSWLSADNMPTHRISATLIVKWNQPHERAAMDFVRRHTRIPVPQVRQRHLRDWMASDFVEGNMLFECWDALNLFMKFRVACTMRCYLSQLRRLKGTLPGSLESHVVSGPLFECEPRGPFESLARFQAWCEMVAITGWCSTAAHFRNTGRLHKMRPQPAVGGEPWDLVYAHGDLNMTNCLLAKDNVLWIVDWAESGFYPRWFDGATMAFFEKAPRSWHALRPFMAGSESGFVYKYFWVFLLQDVHRFTFTSE